jgi:hypothetical protein
VSRRILPIIGLVVGLAPAVVAAAAHAQTNIDQGKSAAEIFATDCATCHKTTRGLAAGKNSLMLSSFLREHYTASRDQAAALAAYVLGAGGNAPVARQKPEVEHARTTSEEPKTGEPSAAHPVRASAKPEEDEAKPEDRANPTGEGRHEQQPVTATRGQKREPEEAAPVQNSAAVAATPAKNPAPSSAELPEVGPTRSAAAPAESQPSESGLVPRDHIPD